MRRRQATRPARRSGSREPSGSCSRPRPREGSTPPSRPARSLACPAPTWKAIWTPTTWAPVRLGRRPTRPLSLSPLAMSARPSRAVGSRGASLGRVCPQRSPFPSSLSLWTPTGTLWSWRRDQRPSSRCPSPRLRAWPPPPSPPLTTGSPSTSPPRPRGTTLSTWLTTAVPSLPKVLWRFLCTLITLQWTPRSAWTSVRSSRSALWARRARQTCSSTQRPKTRLATRISPPGG